MGCAETARLVQKLEKAVTDLQGQVGGSLMRIRDINEQLQARMTALELWRESQEDDRK